jgi:putative DNA primase/helicase
MTHPAIKFLQHLDPAENATFNIEHYTDLPKGLAKPKSDDLSGRYANLTLMQVAEKLPELQTLNDKGAGIFVAVNRFNGHRKVENLSLVRGIHADMDDITEDQLAVLAKNLQPSIVVQSSSASRCQVYWLTNADDTLKSAETKAINQYLAQHYGADKAAVDVARLLRLPGFKHMKYRAEGKTPTVTAIFYDQTYTANQIRDAFPSIQTRGAAKNAPPSVREASATTPVLATQLDEVAKLIEASHSQLWAGEWSTAIRSSGEIGYPSQSEADLALAGHISRTCQLSGISDTELNNAVEDIFFRSQLGNSDKWKSRSDYRALTVAKALKGLSRSAPSSASNDLVMDSFGDVRNSKVFAQCAAGNFLFVTTRNRWLQWINEKWLVCEKDEHITKAKEVCARMHDTALEIFQHDQEKGKRLLQDAKASHHMPRLTAMLKLTVSEPEMAATDRELDCNPYLLGVANGVVDLRDGIFLINQPSFNITRYCNAGFDVDASCTRWISFLDEIFAQDTATIDCVQRLLGCTLLGLASEEKLVICYGSGSNGKSVFSNIVHKIMGGYSITSPPSMLTTRRQGDAGPRNDLAALAGARYVSINELQAGDRLDEQVVKMLAGREPISARFLKKEFFEFIPTFTPWLRTNHKPIIYGVEEGIWRRLVLLNFGVQIPEDKKDSALEDKLFAERDGILMWMIKGARLFMKEGICISPSMRNDLLVYRGDSDLLGEFLSDATWKSNAVTDKIEQKLLYTSYRMWSAENGLQPMTKKSFTQRLVERGFKETKSGGARFYAGLKWINEAYPSQVEGRMDRFLGNSDYSPF